jgi:hypothetical protein
MNTKEKEIDVNAHETLGLGDKTYHKLKKIVIWIGTILILLYASFVFVLLAYRGIEYRAYLPIITAHFAAVVGLPMVVLHHYL